MLRLAQVGMNDKKNQENSDKITEYVESNFEGTVKNLIKMIQVDEK